MWLYPILTVLLLVIDQLLKWAISANLALNHSVVVIPGVMALTNLHNRGAAWSILEGQQWFFTLISIIAIVIIVWLMYHFRRNPPVMVCLCMILAGTLGNFIDRLRLGYVVDMFETLFINFPVFNAADCCLTLGVIALAWLIIKEDD